MSEVTVQIGADPELFVARKDGVGLPIFGLIGGSKDQPLKMWPDSKKERDHWYTYHEDGAALEFGIPPTTSYDTFVGCIMRALMYIKEYVLAPRGLKVTESRELHLAQAQALHPLARQIGCSVDQYAYDEKLVNYTRTPLSADAMGTARFAGGHIHLSYDKTACPPNIMAQFLDVYIGLQSIFADKQGGRRKFYGLPGLYREKPYGIEYRTLSNYWLFQGENYQYRLANACMAVAQGFNDPRQTDVLRSMYPRIPWGDVHSAIANEDEKLAATLLAWFDSTNLRIMRY